MVNLADILRPWVESLNIPLKCDKFRVEGPCECGSRIRFANVYDKHVSLARTSCECEGCKRSDLIAGDPEFFNKLEHSLRSRVDHKSVVVSVDVIPGDDIQHVIDHFKDGATIKLGPGVYQYEMLNMKDAKIDIVGDATFNNCQFDNIKQPISSSFDASFIGCSFIASPGQSTAALELLGGNSLVMGNAFNGFGI